MSAPRIKCQDCGETLSRIPGGDGPVWVNPAGYAACFGAGKPAHPHAPAELPFAIIDGPARSPHASGGTPGATQFSVRCRECDIEPMVGLTYEGAAQTAAAHNAAHERGEYP